jgi:DNA phosphorothioation-dependent restriction protein DptH
VPLKSLPAANPSVQRPSIAITLFGEEPKKDLSFFPGNTELNQLNVGIVGDLGTGKTQLIQSLLYQLRSHPEENRGARPRVLIFDYKKDYSKEQFVKATGARVISPFAMPLNVFDTRDCAGRQNAWLERSKFFADVLDKIYSGIGPLQRQRIKQAVREAYDRASASGREAPTIYDVFEAYAAICGSQIDSPYSIMSDIVDGEYFVRDARSVLPFSQFLDGVVVIDLAAVGQDDRTKNMLVVMFLNLFYEHMLKIEKRPFLGNAPRLRYVDTMLLVDEADNIMSYEFDVLKRILLQGREFGVGVILASQYLSHFKTRHENYVEPLLTWFVHKVPTITVKELEGIGLTRVDAGVADRVKTLACHECLYKTYDVAGEFMRGVPFYEISTEQK